MSLVEGLLHRLDHLVGWNRGVVVSAHDSQGNLWMGFRCTGCGKISHKALNSFFHPEPPDKDFSQ